MTGHDTYLGLDVGGTALKALVCDARGNVLREARCATADDGTEAWLERAAALVQELGPAQVAGVGIAAPGFASPDGSRIAHMPGRLRGLAGLDWRDFLKLACPVRVLNDAHAALLAEAWCGAGRGASDVLMITLGTGVGGAAMVDGRLLRGRLGRAGHVGHLSLDPDGPPDIVRTPGSLELAIGECSLAARSGGRFEKTVDLLAAVRAGDRSAAEIWDKSVRALGAAIASLINVLDPEVVVIGGGVAQGGEPLFVPLAEYLDRFEWRPHGAKVRVVPAALGDRAGALGAARAVQIARAQSAAGHSAVEQGNDTV
jgi:glucokinase